jgi:peptide/nickel transport system substrate-binding protein
MRLLLIAVLGLLNFLAMPATAQTPTSAQTLRIGMRDDPDILDPTFSRTYVGTVVMTAMCDKLFDFNEKLAIVPGLATGYEWTDSRSLLIHLREGVRFQNDEPFDAAAVKYTLERHLTANASFRRSEIGAMDHAEIVDKLTVRVVMKTPFSPFVAVLTDRAGMMVAPKAVARSSACARSAPARSASTSASPRTASCSTASPATGMPGASITTGCCTG